MYRVFRIRTYCMCQYVLHVPINIQYVEGAARIFLSWLRGAKSTRTRHEAGILNSRSPQKAHISTASCKCSVDVSNPSIPAHHHTTDQVRIFLPMDWAHESFSSRFIY